MNRMMATRWALGAGLGIYGCASPLDPALVGPPIGSPRPVISASGTPTALPIAGPSGLASTGPIGRPIGTAVSLTAGVMRDSGSTNTYGYTIIVGMNGSASYSANGRIGSGQVSPELTQRFFADADAARPLDGLPAGSCAKSASFGSSLTLARGGQTSPDLTCPGDARGQALADDLAAIARELGVQEVPRSTGSPPPPLTTL